MAPPTGVHTLRFPRGRRRDTRSSLLGSLTRGDSYALQNPRPGQVDYQVAAERRSVGNRIVAYFGSGAVVKRLEFLVETLELAHPPEPRVIDEWRDLLSAGISRLDPFTPGEPHRIATRWRIGVNFPEEGLAGRR